VQCRCTSRFNPGHIAGRNLGQFRVFSKISHLVKLCAR
jgi:hypothetical protein